MRLAKAVLAKDRKATAEFVNRHSDTLYAYLQCRLVPRVDLVDDLLQEVFLAAWENLDRFRGESSLKSWLLGIARHKVEDYYRKKLREPEPLEDTHSGIQTLEPLLDERLDRRRLLSRTRSVFQTLPEPYAVALLWRYWEGRSAKEMAAQTGKTVKAVERLLARARAKFRQRWSRE